VHAETVLDATEAVMPTDLREQERDELLHDGAIRCVAVALMLLFEFLEFVSRKNLEQLSLNRRNKQNGLKFLLNKALIETFGHFQYGRFLLVFRPSLFFTGHYLLEVIRLFERTAFSDESGTPP
jgi:hypothetical protein